MTSGYITAINRTCDGWAIFYSDGDRSFHTTITQEEMDQLLHPHVEDSNKANVLGGP